MFYFTFRTFGTIVVSGYLPSVNAAFPKLFGPQTYRKIFFYGPQSYINCPINKDNTRRYSTISRGFFQKNLTDKMNSTYRRVNKKK